MDELSNLLMAIGIGDIKRVECSLKKIPHDIIHSVSKAALSIALESKNIEIYEYLISNGLASGSNENASGIAEQQSYEIQRDLRLIHRKYFKDPQPKHLRLLSEKLKLSHDADESQKQEYWKVIQRAISELNDLKDIEPILKIISLSDVTIVFDFNSNSVKNLDPTKNQNIFGVSYFFDNFVYIGAKFLLDEKMRIEVLATLAHEMCHFVLNIIYDNFCKPYRDDDEQNRKSFDRIMEHCKLLKSTESIVNEVFSYPPDKIHSELIVRVPHLLVLYKDNEDMYMQCLDTFDELFKFYEEKTLQDLKLEYKSMQAMQQVKELNRLCRLSAELRHSIISLNANSIAIDLKIGDQAIALSSNCPKLTMYTIYHNFCDFQKFEASFIFLCLKDLNFLETFESVVAAYKLCTKPMIIIDCDEQLKDDVFKYYLKLYDLDINQRVAFVVNDYIELPTGLEKVSVNHSWSHLSNNFQNKLMLHDVIFQGRKMLIEDLIDFSSLSRFGESIPINEFLSEKEIEIGTKPCVDDFYFERELLIKNEEESVINQDKFLELYHECAVAILLGEPGIGKTIEMKRIEHCLGVKNSNRWISYIDLQNSAQVLNKIQDLGNLDDSHKIVSSLSNLANDFKEFDSKIFKYKFISGEVMFLFDSFDKVISKSRKKLVNLIKIISKQTKNRVLIATRPRACEELKNELETYTLVELLPFSTEIRQEFFKKIFLKHYQLKEIQEKFNNFESFCLKNFETPIANPTLIEIVADIFKSELNLSTDKNLFQIIEEILLALVELSFVKNSEGGKSLIRLTYNFSLQDLFQKQAIKALLIINENEQSVKENVEKILNLYFNFDEDKSFQHFYQVSLLDTENYENSKFIHLSFVKFFVIKFLMNQLFLKKNENPGHGKLFETLELFVFILTNNDKQSLVLLDGAFESMNIQSCIANSVNIMRDLFTLLEKNNNNYFLHRLVQYDCLYALKLFVQSRAIYLWSMKDSTGNNILFTAANYLTLESFKKLNILMESFLGLNFIPEMLCENTSSDRCILIAAIKNSDTRIFQSLVSVLKSLCLEDFNKIELNVEFRKALLNSDNIEIYDYFLKVTAPESLTNFIFARDSNGENILHISCSSSNALALEITLKIIPDEKAKEILLSTTSQKSSTALILASCNPNASVIVTIWRYFTKVFDSDIEVRRNFLEMKDTTGLGVLHYAILNKQKEIFEFILNLYRPLFSIDELREIILDNSIDENILWFTLRHCPNKQTLFALLSLMERIFTRTELKEIFLKANRNGKTLKNLIKTLSNIEIRKKIKEFRHQFLN